MSSFFTSLLGKNRKKLKNSREPKKERRDDDDGDDKKKEEEKKYYCDKIDLVAPDEKTYRYDISSLSMFFFFFLPSFSNRPIRSDDA